MTPQRIAELRELADGATPGPWEDSDTHSTAATREALSELLAEVQRVRALVPMTDPEAENLADPAARYAAIAAEQIRLQARITELSRHGDAAVLELRQRLTQTRSAAAITAAGHAVSRGVVARREARALHGTPRGRGGRARAEVTDDES